jgi:hypothetical protein
MNNKSFFFVGLVLALSIGLNVWFLVRPGRSATNRPRKTEPAVSQDDRCRADLARCRRKTWDLVLRLTGRARAGTRRSQPNGPERPEAEPEPPAGPDTDVDFQAQQKALCEIAREDLYRRWRSRRGKAASDLIRSLRNREKQEKDLVKDANEFAKVLDLSPSDRDRLLDEYRTVRRNRFEAALDALKKDPPDHLAVFEEAMDLFADEDRLVRRLFGPKAEQKLRRSQLKKRTVIMALLAAHAGLPWDDGITW